ncbi:tyrosine-type recombinase/integrase [Ferrovum myxofaciens]|uniref:tyrosine-type recombinase/integrase n=1 Tax=Ferrovum myxofaciens TaxID=416213 RepID=UPI003EBFFA92
MARQQHKLTALAVSKLIRPGLYGDGAGLTLQISSTGAKSWLLRFMIAGKAYAMGLGATHTVSLADARQKSLEARKLLADGINPLDHKREKRNAAALAAAKTLTFDQCAEAYIMAHKAGWKNAKHIDQWTNTLKMYASPVFGHLSVADVDTKLIMKCLSQIWESKTETASRVRGRIESVLGWATTSGFRTGENPARWKGHLENLLATISKTVRTKNHPSLPWQRMSEFVAALHLREGISARAVEFVILTACRSGEVRGARWAEFSLGNKVWIIPSERMKAKREHQVPLSDAAIALLESIPRNGDLVFSGTRGQVLSDMSLTAVIRRMNADEKNLWTNSNGQAITVHGFRSSFRMWAAENTHYPREVAEHALAHQLPDAVERAYQRGSQFSKRVALMAEWAIHCASTLTS